MDVTTLHNPSPLDNLPLLKSDYSCAEVNLVYLRKKDPVGWNQLLFETIEFMTPRSERGPVNDFQKRLGGSSELGFSNRSDPYLGARDFPS